MISLLEKRLPKTNRVYRHAYHILMIILVIAILFMLSMVLLVLYQVSHRPLPLFYAVADNHKTMALESYNEPNLLPTTLLTWASKAAVAGYTVNFANYDQQVAAARPYFTNNGWANYQNSIASLVTEVRKRKIFVNSVISGTPIIASQGDFPSIGYIWRTQLPFLVTYQTAEELSQKRFMVLITIAKVPTNINPTGIGIDQFVMQ